MPDYGLIGYPLSHSFSRAYFTEKFERLDLPDHRYHLFPLPRIDDLPALIRDHPQLCGLNVTIPHKKAVLPYLDACSPEAGRVGAVNTIRLEGGRLTGYNTDVFGFEQSLRYFLEGVDLEGFAALVLGTGGASNAVVYALDRLGIPYQRVSRRAGQAELVYGQLDEACIRRHRLIVNTTPLGMYPNEQQAPALPYAGLGAGHFLYDLVYNPEKTLFLKEGEKRLARIHNGLRMLHLQAEAAWAIWNDRPPPHTD